MLNDTEKNDGLLSNTATLQSLSANATRFGSTKRHEALNTQKFKNINACAMGILTYLNLTTFADIRYSFQ